MKTRYSYISASAIGLLSLKLRPSLCRHPPPPPAMRRLYEEFLKPILLVGLFAPPEELSAGVVLGMLYFYVLAHQPDFDVR